MGIFNWANILSPQDYGSGKGISIKNNPLSGSEVEANFIAVADYIDNASVLATDTLEKLTTLKATKEAIKKWIVPIGKRYVQYPGDALPNVFFSDLFGGDNASTWTKEWADEGITFSTEGGQALAFNGGVQESCNKAHNHNASSGNQSADHTHTVGVTVNSSGSHVHGISTDRTSKPGYLSAVYTVTFDASEGGYATWMRSAGNHTHSCTVSVGDNSASHNHAITVLDSGETEARMRNRTYCIWKRTA